MKKYISIICFFIFVLSISSFSKEKKFGGSVQFGPTFSKDIYYYKSKKEISYLPSIDFTYGDFSVGTSGLGYQSKIFSNLSVQIFVPYLIGVDYHFQKYPNFSLGLYTNFMDGHSIRGKDMKDGYKSIKKRRTQITTGGRLSYTFDNIQTSLFIQGGKRGSSTGVDVTYSYPLTEKLTLAIGGAYTFYSKKYTNYYFGIREEDLGGKIDRLYSPDDSSSYGLNLGIEYQFTDSLSTYAFISGERYSKEIYKSPIIKEKDSLSASIGLKYSW